MSTQDLHFTEPGNVVESKADPAEHAVQVFSSEQAVQLEWMSEQGWHFNVVLLRKCKVTQASH
jgi:hypothetical protein